MRRGARETGDVDAFGNERHGELGRSGKECLQLIRVFLRFRLPVLDHFQQLLQIPHPLPH